MRFVRDNSLSLFFGTLLLLTVLGQSVAGEYQYNADALEHGSQTISWSHYLVTPEFGGDLLENWESEFLQFSLYILATVWLLQRGSNESTPLNQAGLESDEKQKVGPHAEPTSPSWARAQGARQWIYANSLLQRTGARVLPYRWATSDPASRKLLRCGIPSPRDRRHC